MLYNDHLCLFECRFFRFLAVCELQCWWAVYNRFWQLKYEILIFFFSNKRITIENMSKISCLMIIFAFLSAYFFQISCFMLRGNRFEKSNPDLFWELSFISNLQINYLNQHQNLNESQLSMYIISDFLLFVKMKNRIHTFSRIFPSYLITSFECLCKLNYVCYRLLMLKTDHFELLIKLLILSCSCQDV